MARARERKSAHTPLTKNTGSKNSAASTTRTPAVGSGPSSAAPKRMKRNDEPQRAASRKNSAIRLGDIGAFGVIGGD